MLIADKVLPHLLNLALTVRNNVIEINAIHGGKAVSTETKSLVVARTKQDAQEFDWQHQR